MLPDINDRVKAAAKAVEQAMLEMHRDERGTHVNTLVSTAAAVAGEAAQRATIPEGELYGRQGMLLSAAVDSIVSEAKDGNILDYIKYTAEQIGLPEHKFPNIDDIFAAAAMGVERDEVPVLTVGEDHQPRFWALAGAAYARAHILEIYKANRLSPAEAALAATLALCRVLHTTKGVIAPEIVFRLALETLAGAIKVHPVAVEQLEQMEARP